RSKPPNPSGCREGHETGEPTEQPDKNDLRVGRFKKQIASTPLRIPVMLQPGDVMSFIDTRRKVAGGDEENQNDQQNFDPLSRPALEGLARLKVTGRVMNRHRIENRLRNV